MTPSSTSLRIGVFGGAFDPPHRGHVALAKAAIAQLHLDRLMVIPTGHAWHKAHGLSAPAHRLAMTRLTFADMPTVQVDDRETTRPGASYTVDTLRELRSENPGAEFYLLIGEDQARALQTWHAWEQLPSLAIICVAARADSTGAKDPLDALSAAPPGLTALNMPPEAVSATEIRHRAALGESIAPLVFEPVARYIDQHLLYRSN